MYARAIAQTENRISILLGQLPGGIQTARSLSDQADPPDIPVGMPSTLLERLFSADLQLSELQQLHLIAYVNLYKSLGGRWITKAVRAPNPHP